MVAKRSAPLPADLLSPLPRVSGPFLPPGAHGDFQKPLDDTEEVTDDMIVESENIHNNFSEKALWSVNDNIDDDDDDEDFDPERQSSGVSSGSTVVLVSLLENLGLV